MTPPSIQKIFFNDITRAKFSEGEEESVLEDLQNVYKAIKLGCSYSKMKKLHERKNQLENRIVEGNLPYVIAIARNFTKVKSKVYFLDLVQEGSIALLKSIPALDLSREVKVTSFARKSIVRAMTTFLIESVDVVSTTRTKFHEYVKYEKVYHAILAKTGERPTPEEVRDKTGMSLRKINDAIHFRKHTVLLENDDTETQNIYEKLIDNSPGPASETFEKERDAAVEKMLKCLSDREETVIRYFFGFDKTHSSTLQSVADKLGITPQGVRFIKGEALKKLRHPSRIELLRELVGEFSTSDIIE
jgi:RNA polymerase primary sigma factor